MSDRYYEDFKVGDRFVSGGLTMTEAGIIHELIGATEQVKGKA